MFRSGSRMPSIRALTEVAVQRLHRLGREPDEIAPPIAGVGFAVDHVAVPQLPDEAKGIAHRQTRADAQCACEYGLADVGMDKQIDQHVPGRVCQQ